MEAIKKFFCCSGERLRQHILNSKSLVPFIDLSLFAVSFLAIGDEKDSPDDGSNEHNSVAFVNNTYHVFAEPFPAIFEALSFTDACKYFAHHGTVESLYDKTLENIGDSTGGDLRKCSLMAQRAGLKILSCEM